MTPLLYENEVAQDEGEIAAFCALLKAESIKSYLEIGSKFGGSLWRVAQIMEPSSRIVSVDLPNGTKAWAESSRSLTACIDRLKQLGHDARVIWGGSTEPAVIEQVRVLAPFDAVLIDANHTLPFLQEDWENYGPMARIVAFHDIAWHRAPEWHGVRIDVPQFWTEIKANCRHQEFKFCPTGKNNGIGVLWRS